MYLYRVGDVYVTNLQEYLKEISESTGVSVGVAEQVGVVFRKYNGGDTTEIRRFSYPVTSGDGITGQLIVDEIQAYS